MYWSAMPESRSSSQVSICRSLIGSACWRSISTGEVRQHHLHGLSAFERGLGAEGGTRSTFRELNDRVARIAAALSRHGFGVGERLAILLPNEPEYIELVYACSWLGGDRGSIERTIFSHGN